MLADVHRSRGKIEGSGSDDGNQPVDHDDDESQTNDDEDDENSANKDDTGDVGQNEELCTD